MVKIFFYFLVVISFVVACSSSPHDISNLLQPWICVDQEKPIFNEQGMYVFYNHSQMPLELNREIANNEDMHAGSAAGWTSTIQPDQWSALSLSLAPFVMNCTSLAEGKRTSIACEKVLSVCQLKLKETQNLSGSYWLAENITLDKLKTLFKGKNL